MGIFDVFGKKDAAVQPAAREEVSGVAGTAANECR